MLETWRNGAFGRLGGLGGYNIIIGYIIVSPTLMYDEVSMPFSDLIIPGAKKIYRYITG